MPPLVRSVQEWMESAGQMKSGLYAEFDLPPPSRPKAPKTTDEAARQALRYRFRPSGQPFAAAIRGARFGGERGVVFAPDGTVLQNVSARSAIENADLLPPPIQVPGTIAPVTFKFTNNYFHWMFDVLPRFELLRRSGLAIDRYLICPQGNYPYRDTLEKLGIPEEKVTVTDPQLHIQPELLVVTPEVSHKRMYPRWAYDFVRNELLSAYGSSPAGKERLFVSRAGALNRRLENEAELLPLLHRYGFRPIRPELLTLSEQIRLFQSAEAIVAPHGAGLTNLLFAQPGVKLLELFSPHYIEPYYWVLSEYAGADYYCMVGEAAPSAIGVPNGRVDPMTVSAPRLLQLLDVAGLG